MEDEMTTTEMTKLQTPDVMTLGHVFARSGYFQDAKEQAQGVVKILAGQELGFGPVASMTGVYIVKGRVTLSANLMAAAVKRSGKYNYRIIELTDTACKIDFYERGEKIGQSEFSMDDAKTAGLATENYRKFARNMLFARALSNGVKWHCADVMGGPVYTPDELGATIDMETGEMIDRPADEVITAPPAAPAKQPELGLPFDEEDDGPPRVPPDEVVEPAELEEKQFVLGRVQGGFDKLQLSPPERQAKWNKHTGGTVPFLSLQASLESLNGLLDELKALHRSRESRKPK